MERICSDINNTPTLKHLHGQSDTTNFFGSEIRTKREKGGRIFRFYADRSVLIEEPEKGRYHFITKEGRKILKPAVVDEIKELISDTVLSKLKFCGSGSKSKTFELTVSDEIIVKVTSSDKLLEREFSAEISRSKTNGRTMINADLVSSVGMIKRMQDIGISDPVFYAFYGFSIDTETIKEFRHCTQLRVIDPK